MGNPVKKKNDNVSKTIKSLAFWLLVGLIIFTLFQSLQVPKAEIEEVPYSGFLLLVRLGQVTEVKIVEQDILGFRLKKGKKVPFKTFIPYDDPNLVPLLEENGVDFFGTPPAEPQWWMNLLYSVFPILLLFGLFWFFLYRQVRGPGNRALSFGRSRAKMLSEEHTKFTFADVAGVEEAKEELKEVIEFLKDPKKFQKLGAKIPKGVLLVGPPGTGKTLLAKAVAGEADVPFFSISGSDFVEMFVGVGASRVRDLFDQGKKHAPCIIFIDEIDAVGRMRGAGLGGGHDEREQTLNQLLVEMDGFNTAEGVILIAATNRPDVLDAALLRPGRFDRHIVVDAPDLIGREGILKVHFKDKKVDEKLDIKIIARRTPGLVGSDLANVVNEAALLAARRNKESITMKEVDESIERVIAGPERKSKLISEREKKMIAYHEVGHALTAKLIPGADPVHKISIMPRGKALGYTLQLPIEDKYLTTKTEILDKMAVLLGGRVAEELVFGELTTGAQNDLERATEAAHKMVCEYGMSDTLGPLTFGRKEQEVFLGRDFMKEKNYSEEVAAAIDKEVRNIIETSYDRAKSKLIKHKDKLDKLATILIEREILEADEIDLILAGKQLPPKEIEEEEEEVVEEEKREKKKKVEKEEPIDEGIIGAPVQVGQVA
ncbi:MAG: ATP-dependent zinc metalloprotease FtsH [bacterium]